MRACSKAWSLLATAALVVYFLRFTASSLQTYFSPDDTMNLHRSWSFPLTGLLKANVLFFLNSPFYRPVASAWYRIIFYFAGFDPAPFHAVLLIVLMANMWLTYSLSRRLTGSREVGVLSALLIAYHPSFGSLYFDTAYCYDVLCFFFYFSALLLYVRARQQERELRPWELALCLGLYVLALGSKEIAVTLPVFLAIYEFLYGGARFSRLTAVWDWLKKEGRGLLATGSLTVIFLAGRLLDRHDSLLTNDAYIPVFSWGRFMETSRGFLGSLFLRPDNAMSSAAVLAIWVVLFAVAWLSKSRALKFAWLFIMFSVLPIAFILPRGASQYYVPFFGWAFYLATFLVRSTEFLAPGGKLPALYYIRAAALFVGVVLFLNHFYRPAWRSNVALISLEPEEQRSIVEQLHQLRPMLAHDSRVIFLDDPFTESYQAYQMKYLVQLSYRDASIDVDRAKSMDRPPDTAKIAAYDYVFDYRLGRFFGAPQPRPQGPEPSLLFQLGQPAVFHQDWTQVSPRNPARAGEMMISTAKDLGETDPRIPSGNPFPKDPLLDVVSPVELRVGGQPAEVFTKIGWPERVNAYRLDFRLPKTIPPGKVPVEITASGISGPPVLIPVK